MRCLEIGQQTGYISCPLRARGLVDQMDGYKWALTKRGDYQG